MWHSIYILTFVAVVGVTFSRLLAQYLCREQFRQHVNEVTTTSLFQFNLQKITLGK
jgi:hypothetical protein